MLELFEAYLDIETTGLSPYIDDITVIGIYVVRSRGTRLVQLVGEKVTRGNLLQTLDRVDRIYTYNGSRFDLPFIQSSLGVDLVSSFQHHDLMYDCWRNNLFGGLKAVEEQLGIVRRLKDIDGYEAVRLWWKYQYERDHHALGTLLEYNKEDVVNLKTLKELLLEGGYPDEC